MAGRGRKRKSGKLAWYVLGGFILALAVYAIVSGASAPDIDYSQYDYTDDRFANPDARFVIEEFADFQCPYCGQTAPVLRAVKEEFDVRVDYKHFPLTQIHPYAQIAAEASECARDQNRFWAYHDVLFDNQNRLARAYLFDYAEGLGLDMPRFEACVENREKQTVVAQDVLDGRQRNVQGTPTIYIDGQQVNYRSYAQFAAYFNAQQSE